MRMFSRLLLPGLLGLIFVVSCSTTQTSAAGGDIQPQADMQRMTQLIIKFRDADFDPSRIAFVQELSRDAQIQIVYFRPMSGGAHVFRVMDITDNEQLTMAIQRLSNRPEILYVEQDRIMRHNRANDIK